MPAPLNLDTPELHRLLQRLTLEQKVTLLTGRDFWSTWPIEDIGLRRIVVSDGPSGVRGEVWDERYPSLNLPSGTALSSSWDPDLAYRYGAVAAHQARSKGVHVVLGPTINLHRSPLGGRHFEAFSEDPQLTGALAAAYVRGVQDNGVGATPKHYIANDFETDRLTASTEVSDKALREVYLAAFEESITQAGAWLVMSSYNSINGVTATEHDLLETPLNTEWGFDGVVISDWTAVRSLTSAAAAQDLVMPGPDGPWGPALVQAVRDGCIPESAVDRKVLRILLLAARVGALDIDTAPDRPVVAGEDGAAFARHAAAEGTVLLANDGILPLDPTGLRRVAVIGHNARDARTQGGGSATVLPERVVSPLRGLREALPAAEVTYSLGAIVQEGLAELPLEQMRHPDTGDNGVLVRFLDAEGGELFREDRRSTALVYFGGQAPITTAATIELSLRWTPDQTGPVRLGFAAVGHGRIHLDGTLVREDTAEAVGTDLGASMLAPPSISTPLEAVAGTPIDVRVDFDMASRASELDGAFAITVGTEPGRTNPDDLIADAVSAAFAADVAVLVVGTNSRVESEGFDRTDLTLPGHQDRLVQAVAATGTPTVVVVNAGSPVLLPWRHDVAAVLVPYFGGQEMGHALADILLGTTEPGGRLPTTWPAQLGDLPVLDVTPREGKVHYTEGIHIGYRAWLKADTAPAYPFGHGLGYTTWTLSDPQVTPEITAGGDATVTVQATNTGQRPGKHVVQVYLSRPDSTVDRPVRWLAGHAIVHADPNQTVRATITLPARRFTHWQDGQWHTEPGTYLAHIGNSVGDLPLEGKITIT